MKVIQTYYKRFHFRSRLEARYAVMFDAAGLEWEYEPEGFELPSGRYLPDFYLPKWDAFIEIKGKKPTYAELKKCSELSIAANKMVILFEGQPETKCPGGDCSFTTFGFVFLSDVFSELHLAPETEWVWDYFSYNRFAFDELRYRAEELDLEHFDLREPEHKKPFVAEAARVIRAKGGDISDGEVFNGSFDFGVSAKTQMSLCSIFAGEPTWAARSARFEFGGR